MVTRKALVTTGVIASAVIAAASLVNCGGGAPSQPATSAKPTEDVTNNDIFTDKSQNAVSYVVMTGPKGFDASPLNRTLFCDTGEIVTRGTVGISTYSVSSGIPVPHTPAAAALAEKCRANGLNPKFQPE